MDFFNLMLAEKIGKVLSLAVSDKKYNRYELIEKWLYSDTYEDTVNLDVHLCSQARGYILSEFESEYSECLPSHDDESIYYADDLYWFGYITTYWFFLEGITGKEIVNSYNIYNILDSYDTLHTLSVQHAIEKIKEDDAL